MSERPKSVRSIGSIGSDALSISDALVRCRHGRKLVMLFKTSPPYVAMVGYSYMRRMLFSTNLTAFSLAL